MIIAFYNPVSHFVFFHFLKHQSTVDLLGSEYECNIPKDFGHFDTFIRIAFKLFERVPERPESKEIENG